MSALLDAAGGPAAEGVADLLVTAGGVAAVPTAAAGLNDRSDTAGPETRVGLVHATVNTTALSLYMASVIARAQGRRRGGQALALAGLGCCWAVGTWEGTCASSSAWMSTAPRGSSGRASGRRCWPTPNWPIGSSAGRRGRRAGPAVPDRRNGVCPGQHLHSHGRPAAGGRNQRWLPHLPMARQHVPVRRRQHHAQPGQHARAQLPDAHPDGRIEVRAFA